MARPIGTLGVIDTLTIGGRVLTDLTTLIVLAASYTSNSKATFRQAFPSAGSAGYAVTSAKTYTVAGIKFNANAATSLALLYADNDVGFDSATAFTNPVYQASGNTTATNIFTPSASSNSTQIEICPMFRVPAGKYLAISGGAVVASALSYGYET